MDNEHCTMEPHPGPLTLRGKGVIIFFETLGLYLTGSDDSLAYHVAWLSWLSLRDIAEWYCLYLYLEVYSVHQRTTDL